jgi:transposase-like protein
MNRRVWSSKEKLAIVLEGIQRETTLAEVCNRHGISQNQYYKWRDKLLESCDAIFAPGGINRPEGRLKSENLKLRKIIADLTIDLKKTLY